MKVENIGHGLFKVYSKDNTYYVIKNNGKFLCTCKGYLFNKKCKHIEEVKNLKEEGENEGDNRSN